MLVIRVGPVERPSSPERATSTYCGRQSSTIAGAGRSRSQSLLTIQPERTNKPSTAKLARNAARMSSRTEWAAKEVSAAASEAGASMEGWWAHAAAASASRNKPGLFIAAMLRRQNGARLRWVRER